MNVYRDALKDLPALAEMKAEGGILGRHFLPLKYPIEGKRLMRKVVETLDWLASQEDTEYDFHTFLEGWFLGAPTSALRHDNVVSFLAWAMYAKEVKDLSKGERKSALEMVKVAEDRLGRTLEPGFNPDVRCIRHTLDPVVPFAHRPLAIYALLGAGRAAIRVFLNLCGFRRGLAPCGTFSYWHREACVTPGTGDGNAVGGPVVFFHGVGSGLPWYILAIWQVCRRRTSIVVESPSITMSLHLLRGHRPPSEKQLVESVEGIMKKHGLSRAAFFGHSFGSIAVAWMARRRPQLVSQVVLLDPVCLLLFLPNVARAFLYPEQIGLSFADKVMLKLVTQEKGISHTLRRHFWWYANVMWPDDIRCPIVVGLAGRDTIVPAKPLRRFLLSHPSFASSASVAAGERTDGRDGSDSGCSGNGVRNEDDLVHSGGGSGGGGGSAAYDAGASVQKGDVDGLNGFERNGGDPSAPAFSSGGDCGKTGAAVKRAELVYWPKMGHGAVLGNPRALSEFMRVVDRQEKAFATNGSSVRNGSSLRRRARGGSKG